MQSHRMVDDMLDYLRDLRQRPVWQPIPQDIRDLFHEPLPMAPTDLAAVQSLNKLGALPAINF